MNSIVLGQSFKIFHSDSYVVDLKNELAVALKPQILDFIDDNLMYQVAEMLAPFSSIFLIGLQLCFAFKSLIMV